MQIFPAGAQSSRDRMHWRHCFFPLWPCRVNKQSCPIRDGGIWIGTCKKGWVIKFQFTHSKFPPKCYFISKFNSPTGSDQPGKGSFTSSKMSWLQTKCLFNNLFKFFLSYLHLSQICMVKVLHSVHTRVEHSSEGALATSIWLPNSSANFCL